MNLLGVYASIAVWSILYMVVHELLHYTSAILLGYKSRLYIASDGILPSLAVKVEGEPQGLKRAIILYSPYLFNVIVIFSVATLPLKLIALLTLPNMLLEERRSALSTSIAAASMAMMLVMIGMGGLGMIY